MHIQQSIIKLGPVTLFQVTVGVLGVIGLSLYNLIVNRFGPGFYYVICSYAVSFLIMVVHYYLSKKYPNVAIFFSPLQSINALITTNELIWVTVGSIS